MQLLEKFQETRLRLLVLHLLGFFTDARNLGFELLARASVEQKRGRPAIAGLIVGIAIALILFATIGIIALQLLATAGSTSFQPSVVTMVYIVIPVVAAVAVVVGFLKLAGVRI